jgi:DNA-binding transcriptional MerR regulator
MKKEFLTLAEVAEMCGLQPGTLSAYRARGYMPKPDQQFGRTPLWRPRTINKWRAQMNRAQKSGGDHEA